MGVSLCLSVCVCLFVRDHIFGTTRPIFANFSCTLPMAVARSSSGGVVICYVLPVLWMTIISAHRTGLLDVAAQLKRRAQRTRSLGLGYKLCAVIPAAGQRTCGTTFRAFQLTSHVATTGAESAVYDCIVVLCRQNCWANGVGWTRTLSCCCRPPTR